MPARDPVSDRGHRITGDGMDGATTTPETAAGTLWPALAVPALGAGLAVSGVFLAGGLRGPAGPDPAMLVGLVAAVSGSAVVLAWAIAAALAVAAVLARRHRRARVAVLCEHFSPALLRRAAAALLGLQLVGLPAASADDAVSPFWRADDRTPVHATPTTPGQGPSAEPSQLEPTGPAEVPARAPRADDPVPVPTPAPRADDPGPVPTPAQRTVDGAVTVVRGDTLWSLAAAHLGPGATDAQIAGCWPAWYELNRHVLLDGPHLILPGQRLLVPGRDTTAPSAHGTPPHQIPGGPS